MARSPEITDKALMPSATMLEALEVSASEAGDSFILRLLKGQRVNPFAVLTEVQDAASLDYSGHPRADAILGRVLELTGATFSLMSTTQPVDLTEYHRALLDIERAATASQKPALEESQFLASLDDQIAWARKRLPFDPYETLDRIHNRIHSLHTGKQILPEKGKPKPRPGFCANLVAQLAREVPQALNSLADRPIQESSSHPFAQYLSKVATVLARLDELESDNLRAATGLAEIKAQVEKHVVYWLEAQAGPMKHKQMVETLKRLTQLIQAAHERLSDTTKPFAYLVTWAGQQDPISLVDFPKEYRAGHIWTAVMDYLRLKKRLGVDAQPYLIDERQLFEFIVSFAQCTTAYQPEAIRLLGIYLKRAKDDISREKLRAVLNCFAVTQKPTKARKSSLLWYENLEYPDQ